MGIDCLITLAITLQVLSFQNWDQFNFSFHVFIKRFVKQHVLLANAILMQGFAVVKTK